MSAPFRKLQSRRSMLGALLALAFLTPIAARLLAGPNGALVHVRWREGIDDETRARLETRFTLTQPERLDGTTWRYDLIDASVGNVRALVDEPAAEDTHHIDRGSGTIASSATRTPRRAGMVSNGDTLVWFADLAAAALIPLTGFAAIAGRLRALQTSRAAALPEQSRSIPGLSAAGVIATAAIDWLTRGIPATTAHVAGAFRIVFGTVVVWFFLVHPEGAGTLDAAFHPLIEGELHARVVDWMRAHPYVPDALTPWLVLTGVAFIVGAFTRVTYFLFVAGAVAWLFVATTHDSTHPHSTLGLTLIALLPSRWGDALSVDAWRRRARGEQTASTSRIYGYSTWAPGFVFGIAFAAAAWAKLSRTPGWADWILNGSVKYHFITDAHNAPVDWGLQLAGYPSLAVLASLGAVAVESLVITAAFSRSEWYRLTMGAAAMSLLLGFWLFMGVFWPGWWILLLGFLPWRRFPRVRSVRLQPDPSQARRESPPYAHVRSVRLQPDPNQARREGPPFAHVRSVRLQPDLRWAQLTMIVLLLGQQVAFSAQRIERSPMFTWYPMYSSTYSSSDDFDAAMVPYYRIVVTTAEGNVELPCNAHDNLVDDFRTALQGSTDASARVWDAVKGCGRNLRGAKQVTIEGDRHVFDWRELKFNTTRAAVVLGPIAAETTAAGSARD
jgi:hypothetical protein